MGALQPGDPASVGRYRLLGRLGAGGMGQVFLGISPGGRKVAVKLIHPVHAGTAQFRERFAREIEAAQLVGGFHTAPVVDADPHADPPWMVTAYIDGPSLGEAVERDGPLPPNQVRALGAGLAEGLGAIHARGLVHRDLKPGNVILAADGPRIIDFGIARTVDATSLTTAGVVVGTVAYMSPEQIRGDPAGLPSDVFALGSVLAFAATGRPPFGEDSAVTVMFRIVTQPPDLAGLADCELAGLIAGCLAKASEARSALPDLLAALSSPGPAPVVAGAPGNAARSAVADGKPGQIHASTPPEIGPGRETAAPLSQSPATWPPKPPTPTAARHAQQSRGRARRRQAALIAAAAVLGALTAILTLLLTSAAPRTATAHTPSPDPSATSQATTHTTSSPRATSSEDSPQPAHRRSPSPESTADGTIRAGSTGPQLEDVPDVIGLTVQHATMELQDAGFQVQVNKYGPVDKVFDYSPVGQAQRGSTITIDAGF